MIKCESGVVHTVVCVDVDVSSMTAVLKSTDGSELPSGLIEGEIHRAPFGLRFKSRILVGSQALQIPHEVHIRDPREHVRLVIPKGHGHFVQFEPPSCSGRFPILDASVTGVKLSMVGAEFEGSPVSGSSATITMEHPYNLTEPTVVMWTKSDAFGLLLPVEKRQKALITASPWASYVSYLLSLTLGFTKEDN